MREPADENEALRDAEERFLENESVSPDDQMGYTIEDDGTFYPEYGPYGKFHSRTNVILMIVVILFLFQIKPSAENLTRFCNPGKVREFLKF